MEEEKKLKYVCSQCEGENIQIKAWINPNTNEYIEDVDDDDCWCEDCNEHVKMKLIEV